MATKRSISPSNSPPLQKASRAEGKPSRELLCNLPPTCNRGQGTILLGTRELEAHYAKYHAHVCAVPDCECVFPDSRLLELHFTERHDPLAKVKQERGEKIFACHLASCGQHFRNPKNRRLHLIQAHGYPKEYFFAITNKGIGGLLRKWGDGASLMRGTWKARDTAPTAAADSDSDIEDDKEQDDMDDDDEVLPTLRNGVSAPTQARASKNGHASTTASTRSGTNGSPATGRNGLPPADATSSTSSAAVDALAGTMSTLSLVPSSVRFGRGAKSSGHIGRHSHSSQADPPISPSSTDARQDIAQSQSAMDSMKEDSSNAPHAQADTMDQDANPYFRGRGLARARGSRGRGGFPRSGYGVPRGVQRGMMYRGGRGRGAAMNVG